jgi:fructose-1,6-bisphosphatase II
MLKIASGHEGRGILDINLPAKENLQRLANAKKCRVADLTAVILDRPRHKELIQEVREAGARIQLIGDGDVAASIACCDPNSGVDILFGIGGAPEGVISAAALRCMGGEFQGILKPRNAEEIARAKKMGIDDMNKVFKINELARGNVMFCATGVTTGNFLKGVQFKSWGAITHSIVMRSSSGTVRRIEAEHRFDTKPLYKL